MSQSTYHPDSFPILAVPGSMGDKDSQEPKRITIWTSMTLDDLDETCRRAFSLQPVYKIEVLWKDETRESTNINTENCSQVLRMLEGRNGNDKLVIYSFDDDDMNTEYE